MEVIMYWSTIFLLVGFGIFIGIIIGAFLDNLNNRLR